MIRNNLFVLALVTVCTLAYAQADLQDRAREVLQKLNLESEYRAGELTVRDTELGGAKLESSRMSFHFAGNARKFSSFRWQSRLDEIRNRGEYSGQHFRSRGELDAAGKATLARFVGVASEWRQSKMIDASTPGVGEQTEFQSGALAVEFERWHDEMRVASQGAQIVFDSEDGNVVSLSIIESNLVYGSTDNMFPIWDAYDRAKAHAVAYLNESMPEYADAIISKILPEAEAQVSVSFGPMSDGFDSQFADYAGVVPPVYTVRLGPIDLLLHAVTGECVGGGILSEALSSKQQQDTLGKGLFDDPIHEQLPARGSSEESAITILIITVAGTGVVAFLAGWLGHRAFTKRRFLPPGGD